MIIRQVQVYGQMRLGKLLAAPLGLLVTLSVRRDAGGTPAILIAAYEKGDEDDPEHTIIKLCDSRLTIPVKLREAAGIERHVELLPQGGGQVLIKPRKEQ